MSMLRYGAFCVPLRRNLLASFLWRLLEPGLCWEMLSRKHVFGGLSAVTSCGDVVMGQSVLA